MISVTYLMSQCGLVGAAEDGIDIRLERDNVQLLKGRQRRGFEDC